MDAIGDVDGLDDYVNDPVAAAHRVLTRLQTEDRSQWSAAARAERVEELTELCDLLEAERLRAIGDFDRDRAWQVDNAVSANGWLTAKTQATGARASQTVRSARLARTFDDTGTALAAGDLSPAKLGVLATHVNDERRPLYERDEATLLEAARRIERVDDFAKIVSHWAKLADDQLTNDEAVEGRRRQRLHLSLVGDRGFIKGELSADSYALVAASIKALLPSDAVDLDGHRPSLAERRAEAFVEVHRRAVATNVANGGGPTSAVQVVIDVELLADERSQESRAEGEGEGEGDNAAGGMAKAEGAAADGGVADTVEADAAAAPTKSSGTAADTSDGSDQASDDRSHRCSPTDGRSNRPPKATDGRNPSDAVEVDLTTARHDIVGVGPVPVETVRRLLCDSYAARVIMRGRSEVLDLGRQSRFFSASQKRGMTIRDEGCIAQGCDRGPDWCEGHHLREWEPDGLTDLDNGALLCSRHHHLIHEGGWQIREGGHGRLELWKPDRREQSRRRHFHADPDRAIRLAVRKRVEELIAQRAA